MAASSKRNHFILEPTNKNEHLLTKLCIKERVIVLRSETEVVIKNESQEELGLLSSEGLEEYHPNVQFEGYVRSIVKDKNQSVVAVHVTIIPKKREIDVKKVPRWEAETMEEGWLLEEQHYELLVTNEKIRSFLKDPELQRILKAVDTADNRETALHEAYESTELMKDFLGEVLDTIELEKDTTLKSAQS